MMRRWLGIIIIFLGITLLCSGLYLSFTYQQYQQMLERISLSQSLDNQNLITPSIDEEIPHRKPEQVQVEQVPKEKTEETKEIPRLLSPFPLLIYGIDKRSNSSDRGRPDQLMVALVNPMKLKISLISIPRDAYVDIPNYGKHKLNTSYSRGGIALTMSTIEQWLDIKLKGYMSIDFEGFRQLVDLVNGLEIEVDRDMDYDDPIDGTSIHLQKGKQILNGKQALDYVRFRYSNHGPADSDYQRMVRQQQVLKILGDKLVSLSSITKIFEIMSVLGNHLQTTLTPAEIDSLIRRFRHLDLANLETTSIQGTGKYERNLWFEVIAEEELQRIRSLIKDFLEESPEQTA